MFASLLHALDTQLYYLKFDFYSLTGLIHLHHVLPVSQLTPLPACC